MMTTKEIIKECAIEFVMTICRIAIYSVIILGGLSLMVMGVLALKAALAGIV